jgi:hypothetical protein
MDNFNIIKNDSSFILSLILIVIVLYILSVRKPHQNNNIREYNLIRETDNIEYEQFGNSTQINQKIKNKINELFPKIQKSLIEIQNFPLP